ncbi:MAG: aldehyde dehydrogenase (NADP(+)) [Microbacteriaceae bacterium]|nr:aldehyde dehydrogenase (NADP(+)) [Microbacteriaceae bacterium]
MTKPEGPDAIVAAAATAHRVWSRVARATRADGLAAVADALDAAADELIEVARAETHLAEARLRGELARTTFQLRLFGDVLRDGGYLDVRVDHADPDWGMGPRPDLRRTSQAVGPVIVYAASNFPFAFSVAGGDTASALAAGASVIVKAHAGHPELSRRTARVVVDALRGAGAPEGVFALVEGREDGIRILRDPRVKAGSFTGSIPGGRALFDIAVSRPDPIPFFGELGSVNPVFVTEAAARTRGADIARDAMASVTLGSGQFCTKPGVLLVPEGSAIVESLRGAPLPEGQRMLNDRIHDGYVGALQDLRSHDAVEVIAEGDDPLGPAPSPTVLLTTLEALTAHRDELFQECFGPTVLVATYRAETDLVGFARGIEGQLTATIAGEEDDEIVPALVDELREKAGRLLWNQWPTGVSVTFAQQHGGPYPATTAPGATSVGTAAIARFLRPVAFQGFPQALLPDEVAENPGAALVRRVDGAVELRD